MGFMVLRGRPTPWYQLDPTPDQRSSYPGEKHTLAFYTTGVTPVGLQQLCGGGFNLHFRMEIYFWNKLRFNSTPSMLQTSGWLLINQYWVLMRSLTVDLSVLYRPPAKCL